MLIYICIHRIHVCWIIMYENSSNLSASLKVADVSLFRCWQIHRSQPDVFFGSRLFGMWYSIALNIASTDSIRSSSRCSATNGSTCKRTQLIFGIPFVCIHTALKLRFLKLMQSPSPCTHIYDKRFSRYRRLSLQSAAHACTIQPWSLKRAARSDRTGVLLLDIWVPSICSMCVEWSVRTRHAEYTPHRACDIFHTNSLERVWSLIYVS